MLASAHSTDAERQRAWKLIAYSCAAIVALGAGYFVARSPLQLNDGIDNMLDLQQHSLWELVTSQFHQAGYFRPMLWAALKITFDLSNGHYFEVYKSIHVLQLLTVAILFVRLLSVETLMGALAVPFGMAALFGGHTIAPLANEGFPINHFLTVLVCCLAAANLAFGKPALWRDVAAVVLFLVAVLTVESGLLVWVIIAAAWLGGCRGVSNRMLLMTSVALLGYFGFRFGLLHAGTPSLLERSSGFGFRVLEPPEIVARFGERPAVFYAYNVISQILTVLVAEPKRGVWEFTRGITTGEILPREIIAVVASTGATILIAGYAVARARSWRHRIVNNHDRLILVFVGVLGANAAISFPYTKTWVTSPAGVFHALAATVAMAHALAYLARSPYVRPTAVLLTVALTLLSGVWAFRLAGLHYRLHEHAFKIRNDWARMGPTSERWGLPGNLQGQALVRQLYDQAIRMQVPGTYFYPGRMQRYFEEGW